MEFSQRQIEIKSRLTERVRESGKTFQYIADNCPSINSKTYVSQILSSAQSGRTLKQPYIDEVCAAIGIDSAEILSGLPTALREVSTIEYDSSHRRSNKSLERYIKDNKQADNIDEEDEHLLRSIILRGHDLDNVTDASWREILRALRRDVKNI